MRYTADMRSVEDVLKYFCDYCRHRKHCQLRETIVTNSLKWNMMQADFVNKNIKNSHCKQFEDSDQVKKPRLPNDNDRR